MITVLFARIAGARSSHSVIPRAIIARFAFGRFTLTKTPAIARANAAGLLSP